MIELSVIFGLYVLVSSVIVIYLVKTGREERQELEDRVMALSKPDAVILHKAARDTEGANDPVYVDEDKEYELQHKNGRPELLGDD